MPKLEMHMRLQLCCRATIPFAHFSFLSNDTILMVSFHQSHLYIDEASNYNTEELLEDHAYFVQPIAAFKNGDVDPSSLKSKVSELESEVESLREQLCKAKDINDTMWDNIVKRLVSQIGDPEPSTDGINESMEDQRRRKKVKGT